MAQKLLSKKYVFIGLGLIALFGIAFISYNGAQISKTPPTAPSSRTFQPKTATMPKPVKDKPVTGQIIVKFKPQYTSAQINDHLKQYHASIIKTIEGINQTVVKVPAGQEDTIIQQLASDPYVQTSQRDYTTHAFFVPNDPQFGTQYAFNNNGQSVQGQNGSPHADIGIESAWDVTRGNGVKVAILDTGINLNHPDLAGKVIVQKSFISSSVEDGNGHGTHVAGILAADTNNGIGVAGTCPGCKLIIGKILDDTGTGTTSDATAGITWAADQGAKIINLSLGTNDVQTASLYNQAVAYAMQKGAVVVAAAGNDGSTQFSYPAAANGVVSVAGTDNNDKKASWSDFGSWVKIAAPGKNILSTAPTHTFQLEPFGYNTSVPYMYLSGTSMSGPYVAGVAALVSTTQYGTTPQAIINRLYATADKIGGTGTFWVNGRVDAAKAVGPAPTAVPNTSTLITPTLFCVGGAGVPPCATIPPGVSTVPPASGGSGGTNPSGTAASPAVSGGANPSASPFPETNTSPSPAVSGTPSNGSNLACTNIQIKNAFYNLANQQKKTKTKNTEKVHIKCHSGSKKGKGGGGDNDDNPNPNGGWLSKFIGFLLQLLQQLLQLIQQCTGQTPGGTPAPSVSPSVSNSPSSGVSPSVAIPSVSQTPSTNPSNPAPTSSTTSSSCTNPTHVIPMNPSNPQDGITIGNFYLTNDTWNASKYQVSQTLSICNYNNWYVTATMNNNSGDGAVKTYPNVHEDFNNSPKISSFHTIASSFAESGPHVGIYEFAYDMWLNGVAGGGSTEVMIWNDNFGQTPSGSQQATFTDSGQTYKVYKSGSYIAFVDNSNVTSGTVNLLNFFNFIISKGWIPSTSTIGQIDYGAELVSTNNTPATFKVTNFSLTAN